MSVLQVIDIDSQKLLPTHPEHCGSTISYVHVVGINYFNKLTKT